MANSINTNRRILFVFIITLILFIFTILLDLFLGLLGFPSSTQPSFSNPPFYKETRSSYNEFEVSYATNSQGLRYSEIPLKKELPNEKRILVVGDSFAAGYGVEQDQAFASLLETKFTSEKSPVYFINAGLQGIGPKEYLNITFSTGIKYDIDSVLICLYANDLYNTPEDFLIPSLPKSSMPNGPARIIAFVYPRTYTLIQNAQRVLKNKKKPAKPKDFLQEVRQEAIKQNISPDKIQRWADSIPEVLVDAVNQSEFNGSILSSGLIHPHYWADSLDIQRPSAKQKWKNMRNTLDFIEQNCRKIGIDVSVILIPAPIMYDPRFHEENSLNSLSGMILDPQWLTEKTQLQTLIEDWQQERNLEFLDLTPVFREKIKQYPNELNYPLDSHWTKLGHKVASEAIAEWIIARNYLKSDEN